MIHLGYLFVDGKPIYLGNHAVPLSVFSPERCSCLDWGQWTTSLNKVCTYDLIFDRFLSFFPLLKPPFTFSILLRGFLP